MDSLLCRQPPLYPGPFGSGQFPPKQDFKVVGLGLLLLTSTDPTSDRELISCQRVHLHLTAVHSIRLQLRDIVLIACLFRSSNWHTVVFLYYLLALCGKMSTFLIQLTPRCFLWAKDKDNDPFMRGEKVARVFPNLPLVHYCLDRAWQRGLQGWL